MKKKDLLKKILLLTATIILFLVLLELSLRIYNQVFFENELAYYMNSSNYNPKDLQGKSFNGLGPLIRPSPYHDIIFEFKPNLNVTYINGTVITNSLGWRDKLYTIKKPEKTIRIVGLGDSVMFGRGVNQGENYLNLLEQKLNEKYPEFKWEILNFALPAYNTAMELAVLKNYALEYDPDIIIYGYVGNDGCLPDFIVQKDSFFSTKSAIYEYLSSLYNKATFIFKTTDITSSWNICKEEDAPEEYDNMVGVEAIRRSLGKISNISFENNISLIFFHGTEWSFELGNPRGKPIKYVVSAADYFDEENLTKEKMWLNPEDGHPSVYGHKIYSETLFRYLNDSGIINKLENKYESKK